MRQAIRMHYALLFSLVLHAQGSHGVLSNRTIDDQRGDSVTGELPTYIPLDRWRPGQTCTSCGIHPGIVDPGQVFNGTWSDVTFYPGRATSTAISVQVNFTGTAVYMYNLLVNTAGTVDTLTQLDFYLDGDPVGTFVHKPAAAGSQPQVIYNALVYQNTTLSNAPHSLRAVVSNDIESLSLFDYVIYTVDDGDPSPLDAATSSLSLPLPSASSSETSPLVPLSPGSSSDSHDIHSSTHIAAIAGGTVGGVVALIVILLSLCLLRRRRVDRGRQSTSQRGLLPTRAQSVTGGPDATATPYTIAGEGAAPNYLFEPKHRSMLDDPLPTLTTAEPFLDMDRPTHTRASTYGPSVGTASSTERSTQLTRQMQLLQRQVAELRATHCTHADTSAETLSNALAVLRGEIAALRVELGETQCVEAEALALPPSYCA